MEFSETEIKALAQGDTKVFHKLYEHFFVALCIFARSFSLKPEEAEDIVQEVFCRMYDEHRLFEGLNTLKSYLYTAVRNRSFNYLRDEKRRSIREAQFLNNLKTEEEGYNSALENEIYRQLKLLLEELPEQCKKPNVFCGNVTLYFSKPSVSFFDFCQNYFFLPFKYPFLLQAVSYNKKG